MEFLGELDGVIHQKVRSFVVFYRLFLPMIDISWFILKDKFK